MNGALVIGGGPAGAAVATRLAEAGRAVVLVEREAAPTDKVCGEFLSREAGLYLGSLGLDLAKLGAVTIDTLRFYEGSHVATTKLPFEAISLSRRVLDEALLSRASTAGALLVRGSKVNELTRTAAGHCARLDDGATIEANAVFLATGKHDLRGHKRPAGSQSDLVAFKMHFHLAADQTRALEKHIDLVAFDGGYAGLSLVENRIANLCFVIRRARLRALGPWENVLATICAESPHLSRRLEGASPCWPKPLALSAIPYGHLQRNADGLWRLGDQAVVIPSFSGDGMSIALHSAELAASSFLAGDDPQAYQSKLAQDVALQMRLAVGLSHALVRRPAQRALGAVARLWPSLMSTVAFHTRVSDAALAQSMG
ncbi:MAG: lycopene cyclase family protein [Polyangiaceae bacterium]